MLLVNNLSLSNFLNRLTWYNIVVCFEGEGGEIPCIFQSGKVEGSGACITKLYKGTVVFARKLKAL